MEFHWWNPGLRAVVGMQETGGQVAGVSLGMRCGLLIIVRRGKLDHWECCV